MILNIRLLFITGILLSTLTLPLFAHENYKNVKEGVIENKSGTYFIVSPADKYQIRKDDYHIIDKFYQKHKTLKVKVKLVRKHHSELWTVKTLNTR